MSDVQLHDKEPENRDNKDDKKPLTPEQREQFIQEYADGCFSWLKEKTTILGLCLLLSAGTGAATGYLDPDQYGSLFAPVPALLFPTSAGGQEAFGASFGVLLAIFNRRKK